MPPARKNQPPAKPMAPVVLGVGVLLALLATWAEYPGFIVLWAALWLSSWFTTPPMFTGAKDSRGYETPANEHEEEQMRKHRAWQSYRTRALSPVAAFRYPAIGIAAALAAAFAFLLPVAGADWWIVALGQLLPSLPSVPHLVEPGGAGEVALSVANGMALALTLLSVVSARAENDNDFETAPLGTWSEIVGYFRVENWQQRVALAVSAIAAPTVVLGILVPMIAAAVPALSNLFPSPALQGALLGGAVGFGIFASLVFRSLEPDFRRRVDTGRRWKSVFATKTLKLEVPPTVRSSERFEEYDLDVIEFSLSGRKGADVIRLRDQIEAAYNDSSRQIVMLAAFTRDDHGKPNYNQIDQFAFRAVVAPINSWPDLSDRSMPKHVAQVVAECAVTLAGDDFSVVTPIIGEIESCLATTTRPDEDDEDQAEAEEFDPLMEQAAGPRSNGSGGSQIWETVMLSGAELGGHIPATAFASKGFGQTKHFFAAAKESGTGQPVLWLGAVDDDEFEFEDSSVPALWDRLGIIRSWNSRWEQTTSQAKLKSEAKPFDAEVDHIVRRPFSIGGWTPDGSAKSVKRIGRGESGEIETVPFRVRSGVGVEQFMSRTVESVIITTIGEEVGGALRGASWVHIMPWAEPGSLREGGVSATAFQLSWSTTDIFADPSLIPDGITPKGTRRPDATSVAKTVMSSIICQGFDSVRGLQRPTVLAVKNLTGSGATRNIWQVKLDLGGNTVSDVRRGLSSIQEKMGTPWVTVTTTGVGAEPLQNGCYLVFGAKPEDPDLEFFGVNGERHREYVQEIVWETAFAGAKLVDERGITPRKISIQAMPGNPKVTELVWSIPAGKSLADFSKSMDTLKPSTGNSFLEIVPSSDQTVVKLQASIGNPIPFPAPLDWAQMTKKSFGVPFGTAVDGSMVQVDHKQDHHIVVLGGSGSGKSATLMVMMTAILLRGGEIWLGDPIKQATDFVFAKPWMNAFADSDLEVLEMVKAFVAEGDRRNAMRKEYGVSSVRDLPEDVRPKTSYLLLDEFTSTMEFERSPIKLTNTETPEEAKEIQMANAISAARRSIGSMVGKVARELRTADMHLILAGQNLGSKTTDRIPGGTSIKQSSAIFILGTPAWGDIASALKRPSDAPMLSEKRLGRGVFEGNFPPTKIVQSWWDVDEHGNPLGTEAMKEKLLDALGEHGVDQREQLDLATLAKRTEERSQSSVFGEEINENDIVIEEEADDDLFGDFDFGFGDSLSDESTTDDEAADEAQEEPEPTPEPETAPDPIIEPEPVQEAASGPLDGMWLRIDSLLAMYLAVPARSDSEPVETDLGPRWTSPSLLAEIRSRGEVGNPVYAIDAEPEELAALNDLVGGGVQSASYEQAQDGSGFMLSFDMDRDSAEFSNLTPIDATKDREHRAPAPVEVAPPAPVAPPVVQAPPVAPVVQAPPAPPVVIAPPAPISPPPAPVPQVFAPTPPAAPTPPQAPTVPALAVAPAAPQFRQAPTAPTPPQAPVPPVAPAAPPPPPRAPTPPSA